jgi:hypothetical protein
MRSSTKRNRSSQAVNSFAAKDAKAAKENQFDKIYQNIKSEYWKASLPVLIFSISRFSWRPWRLGG